MARIELADVSKVFAGEVMAVDDLSLSIEDGEFMVLVGPSGCGKSTVLRLVAGLEEVTDGVIRIGDRDVTDLRPKERDIAMVFQNYALYPHMTVRENIEFGLKLRRTPKVERDRRVLELPPVVFAAAGDGDVVARAILDRLADEVVAMATAAIGRLRLRGDAFDVVLGGGLFRGADGSLLGRIGAGIAAAAPRASVVRLTAPPIVGAVLLGLDELGAGSAAKRRARQALSEARLAGAGSR